MPPTGELTVMKLRHQSDIANMPWPAEHVVWWAKRVPPRPTAIAWIVPVKPRPLPPISGQTSDGRARVPETSVSGTQAAPVSEEPWGAIVNFDLARADLTEDARLILSVLPAYNGQQVTITGHTDSTGNDAINVPLGYGRALSVYHWLIANKGVNPAAVTLFSAGSQEPTQSNSTERGRALNRRAVISTEHQKQR